MKGEWKDKEKSREKGDNAYERGDILAAAEWYYKAEEFGKAAELFEWEKQYQKAAQSYFKNQEYAAAADNYLKISDEETAIEMFELAREFKKAADVALRIKKYRQAGELFERTGDYLGAGKAYFLLDDIEKALSNLEKINKKDPRSREALLKIAEIFLKTGNYEEIIERIETFINGEPLNKSNLALFHTLAQAYENGMHFKQALDIYRRISRFDPRFPRIQHKLVKIESIIQEAIRLAYSERFKKEQEVGKGAMGVVYRAEDLHLKRPIALKILNQKAITDNSDIDRFFSEARKAAVLQHQNIVTVYDAGQMGNDYFISMEFIRGVDLLTVLKNKHPITITNILVIAHKLFSALDHSHRRGVIHDNL
jgi:tetratricopeptide (TPR) repeat protein